ncbi:hypothetical protein HYDPIDRAFT_68916, partial [Hydnomerulius pinastri MD-312]
RVIGGKKAGPQYQQCTGSRENVTIIITIYADGSAKRPAVILKGNAYQQKLDNLLHSWIDSLGYSKKGWTDGQIGIEWIKEFDKHTKAKVNGQDHLLIINGHNSHYTHSLLEYTRKNCIHVACYPVHTTHIYQGLDVVDFTVLKHCWSEERDKWEREKREGITKANFITIYGCAHLQALTPNLIQTAFRKTGVWPCNRDVVSDSMMAPSKETSEKSHLPI